MNDNLKNLISLINNNAGFVNVILFFLTLFIGWVSGIFKSLIRKPNFVIRIIPKMTFGCTFDTGEKYTPDGQGEYDVYKVGIAVYIEISNNGNQSASLGKMEVGYLKNEIKKWHHSLYRKRVFIKESNILEPFRINAGEKAILIPYLRQKDMILNERQDLFMSIGKTVSGVAYFEQPPCWGNFSPEINSNDKTSIRIKLYDSYGNKFTKNVNIPMISLEEARKLNPAFGLTETIINQSKNGNPNDISKDEKLIIENASN